MDAAFARNVINALLLLYERLDLSHDGNADNLRRMQVLGLESTSALFGASWRAGNAAGFLARRSEGRMRVALLSTAFLGYDHCVGSGGSNFRPSLEATRAALGDAQPLAEAGIIEAFAQELGLDGSADATAPTEGALTTPDAGVLGPTTKPVVFVAPPPPSAQARFESLLAQFVDLSPESDPARASAQIAFTTTLASIMQIADAGRTFTEFAPLEKDRSELAPQLHRLSQSDNPRTLQDRARACRRFAESVDFGPASADEYRYARLAWLVSLYWNSQLTRHWGANAPNTAYDFAGYLTTIQAEIRYSDAEFLLLLRVSFGVCRIISHDGLMPLQFLATAGERLTDWVRHTVGTVLASAGPGRVSPSRMPYDSRLTGDRRDFARALLGLWSSETDRAAAATILLEMGAWSAERAKRLLAQVFDQGTPEYQIWSELIGRMADHARRVRVVRPNPWAPGAAKQITVESKGVAILAADVVNRCYQVLGGDISLRGHDFRERRVPTFVCSAQFGPLGLFKLDTAERVGREVENFAKYAQRLHPRYRASRCDQSKAVITEPDDDKQFVQGALTSYVFTEDETPQTLNSWFISAPPDQTSRLCSELFERALRPWYGHAAPATVDLFAEFPTLTRPAIARVQADCQRYHGLDLTPTGGDLDLRGATEWIQSLLDYVEGKPNASDDIALAASELQVVQSYRSVCHGDLHFDNVLVIGKLGAEYPCVTDFEATHEGYVLKDFGRFASAALLRTFEWTADQRRELLAVLPGLLLDWRSIVQFPIGDQCIAKVVDAILTARNGILRAWQAGSCPKPLELVAAMVASLLPFARYPDTRLTNAVFGLLVASCLVRSLTGGLKPTSRTGVVSAPLRES